MKVDGFLPLPGSFQSNRADEAGHSANQSRTRKLGSIRDEAQLSVSREQVQRLEAEVARVPEVRQERVEALRTALQEGRYRVSNEQIANALFSDLLA